MLVNESKKKRIYKRARERERERGSELLLLSFHCI
jgi:hypothetical protein